jgi:hypothetical protein
MSYRIALYREAEKTLDGLDRTTARRIEGSNRVFVMGPKTIGDKSFQPGIK